LKLHTRKSWYKNQNEKDQHLHTTVDEFHGFVFGYALTLCQHQKSFCPIVSLAQVSVEILAPVQQEGPVEGIQLIQTTFYFPNVPCLQQLDPCVDRLYGWHGCSG
jgi:hypothetical protein